MHVSFVKINPQEYKLQIVREDKSTDEIVLNYREFLRHDLVHFVIEKNAGLSESFYGQIAVGKALADFSPKVMKERGEKFSGELAVTEIIVGPIQGALKSDKPFSVEYLKDAISLQGFEVPEYLDDSFVAATKREVLGLVKRFDSLKVGEALELEFFSQDPKKSFCREPGKMGKMFGKINELGKLKE